MTVSTVPNRLMAAGERASLVDRVDSFRVDAFGELDSDCRSAMGQYPTPPSVAKLMASMFRVGKPNIDLLDAGAGIGSLTAAFVEEMCNRETRPASVSATCYEIEPSLIACLGETFRLCDEECRLSGVRFKSNLRQDDFVEIGVSQANGLFGGPRYDCVIMNPPYRKIESSSRERHLLRTIGVETGNLYAGFLAIAIRLLCDGGELVAITPRSFCNGPYFRPFRKLLLETMAIQRMHVFESRDLVFGDDDVLQENVILHAVKQRAKPQTVLVTASNSPSDPDIVTRAVPYCELVKPGDKDFFIHIVPDEIGSCVAQEMGEFTFSLEDIGLSVSTGKVVDFRARDYLRKDFQEGCVPLVYPVNLVNGLVDWPRETKKPQAIKAVPATADLIVPSATYVLTKRFSSKEEKRRIVAALFEPDNSRSPCVAFENHLNYFHESGKGLSQVLAKGLTAFLNSTLVDEYFRQFSGHTQVNAADLRSLKYPSRSQLESLGKHLPKLFPAQNDLDKIVEKELLGMGNGSRMSKARHAKQKVAEAIAILVQIGLPKSQQNDRSALALLALLGLQPNMSWSQAGSPLMGITPMMEYFAAHYGKKYAPNTRETVRRFTIHQFLQAGIVVMNPDEPRPVNSPDNVYQISPGALELFRSFGTDQWAICLKQFLKSGCTLAARYAAERGMAKVAVVLPDGKPLELTPGDHNILIKHIIEDFCGYYTPGGEILYVGDTGDKHAIFAEPVFADLGLSFDRHGKMPDMVVYFRQKNWLVLIEAVTSHGPVDAKRRHELKELFIKSSAGLVFVTAFMDRKAMTGYLDQISWETEVWVAEAPTHIIHFNGERFLGPFE